MIVCFLGVGSNLGNRRQYIQKAINALRNSKGIKIEKVSHIYETKPVGGPPQGEFLNAAIRIKTALKPRSLLKTLKKIEKDLGRKKTGHFSPRTIDLDILFYADKIVNRKELKIPHPRIFEREFVLKPLSEII